MKIRTENSGQQIKAEHGDMVTIDLDVEASNKLIALLKEHGIPTKIANVKNSDGEDFPHQVLVPAKYAMQFCEIGNKIVNEENYELYDCQVDFFTAVYDSKIGKFLDFWNTIHYLPTAEDLAHIDISDPNADVHIFEIE